MLQEGKLNILLGGCIGSEGKGLLASYIGWFNHVDIAISSAAPNSGHVYYIGDTKHITRQLPISGILNKRSTIYLCAGAIIDPNVLLEEMNTHDISPDRVCIHPRAAIITDDDKLLENSTVKSIASTQKGVGAALVRKINRTAQLARDCNRLSHMVKELDINMYLEEGCTALMEVAQGFDLSINSGISYPYCTSRECTVEMAMSDAMVHPSLLGKVFVVIRTYPIRVGNIIEDGKMVGYSGPFADDSKELNWEDLSVPVEYTTNTNRIRRIATFSFDRYKKMIGRLRPDYVLLNFVNYMDNDKVDILLEQLPEVTHLGHGRRIEDISLV